MLLLGQEAKERRGWAAASFFTSVSRLLWASVGFFIVSHPLLLFFLFVLLVLLDVNRLAPKAAWFFFSSSSSASYFVSGLVGRSVECRKSIKKRDVTYNFLGDDGELMSAKWARNALWFIWKSRAARLRRVVRDDKAKTKTYIKTRKWRIKRTTAHWIFDGCRDKAARINELPAFQHSHKRITCTYMLTYVHTRVHIYSQIRVYYMSLPSECNCVYVVVVICTGVVLLQGELCVCVFRASLKNCNIQLADNCYCCSCFTLFLRQQFLVWKSDH